MLGVEAGEQGVGEGGVFVLVDAGRGAGLVFRAFDRAAESGRFGELRWMYREDLEYISFFNPRTAGALSLAADCGLCLALCCASGLVRSSGALP